MSDIETKIDQLSDKHAMSILSTLAQNVGGGKASGPETNEKEFAIALQNEFCVADGRTESVDGVTEGELAKSTLNLIAENDEYREPLNAMIDGPQAESFSVIGLAAGAAVIMLLKTHFKFERDKEGKISVKIESKPLNADGLKNVVSKLVAYFGIGPKAD